MPPKDGSRLKDPLLGKQWPHRQRIQLVFLPYDSSNVVLVPVLLMNDEHHRVISPELPLVSLDYQVRRL
jgi:hypothetical protein